MFDANLLSIITAMVFIYLMLGLICSVFCEAISGMLAWRSGTTYRGLKSFFADNEGDTLINKVYQHPLIQGLARPAAWDRIARFFSQGAGKPNEIPLVNFLHALRDTVQHLPPDDPKTKEVVDAMLKSDKEEAEKLWDGAEDQLTKLYKTRVQWLIVFLALAISAAANADTLMLFNAFRNDRVLPAAVTAVLSKVNVENLPKEVEKLNEELRAMELFGWSSNAKDRRAIPASTADWLTKIVGLIITTIVVSRTAPYAFDFFRYAVQFMGRKANMPQLER